MQTLVFPIRRQEPFGLLTAESQAAGCPVIGFRGGAAADVIEDGVTGAIVEPGDVEAACAAIREIGRYRRDACRRRAENILDLVPVITAHLAFYDQTVQRLSRQDLP
jgi:glycosyltransferase involved in cell wall biosynthesis